MAANILLWWLRSIVFSSAGPTQLAAVVYPWSAHESLQVCRRGECESTSCCQPHSVSSCIQVAGGTEVARLRSCMCCCCSCVRWLCVSNPFKKQMETTACSKCTAIFGPHLMAYMPITMLFVLISPIASHDSFFDMGLWSHGKFAYRICVYAIHSPPDGAMQSQMGRMLAAERMSVIGGQCD